MQLKLTSPLQESDHSLGALFDSIRDFELGVPSSVPTNSHKPSIGQGRMRNAADSHHSMTTKNPGVICRVSQSKDTPTTRPSLSSSPNVLALGKSGKPSLHSTLSPPSMTQKASEKLDAAWAELESLKQELHSSPSQPLSCFNRTTSPFHQAEIDSSLKDRLNQHFAKLEKTLSKTIEVSMQKETAAMEARISHRLERLERNIILLQTQMKILATSKLTAIVAAAPQKSAKFAAPTESSLRKRVVK